jgi:ribose 5-phosphate isomerase A
MDLKEQAGREAVKYVRNGMVLGLGTGSTSAHFVDALGEQVRQGTIHDIVGIPTSEGTAERARAWGISLTTLAEHPQLDLVVDGADELDLDLNLIKGLGRALLREKIVEIRTRCLLIVADESKVVQSLGRGPLPVEILPFGAEVHIAWLNTLGCRAELWYEDDGSPIVTDNGNNLVRCWFPGGIAEPHALARILADQPGIIEHGLFLGMAHMAIVAGEQGIRVLERPS